MADIADRAQVTEELNQRLAMEALQRRIAATQELETADNCCECDGMIPSARQAAVPGTQHCVGCAEKLEMRARGYRSAA
jgi:RNA polymerase-binding transcription factor DksA